MDELVKYLVCALVDNKDAVEVSQSDGVIKVKVAKDDMGKVIGRQGRTVKSLRTVLKAACARQKVEYTLEVVEDEN